MRGFLLVVVLLLALAAAWLRHRGHACHAHCAGAAGGLGVGVLLLRRRCRGCSAIAFLEKWGEVSDAIAEKWVAVRERARERRP